jgi:hypothetical protein
LATIQQRIAAVTNYTLAFFRRWNEGAAFQFAAARTMLAAGGGTARVHSCEQTFRHVRFVTPRGDVVASASQPEAVFALIESYAANITELHCPLESRCDAADNVLARCTRLESLLNADNYAPSLWVSSLLFVLTSADHTTYISTVRS